MNPTKRSDFRLFHRLRVRWSEVDVQNIVFNAHYLTYFDTAITEYWRAVALPYTEAMQLLGGDIYIVKATVEFHSSARMEDQIEVAMRCARIGNSSLTFKGAIFRSDQHLISGEIVYVFADPASQTSKPVPQALRDILTAYEAGESISSIRVGAWTTLGADAQAIREEVFIKEQGIPKALEQDAADEAALHAVVYNRLGQALATGRLVSADAQGVSKVGRLAVKRLLRGSSVGRAVLQALVEAARARGDRELSLHAQSSAIGFYLRLGWQSRGEGFEEAGIEHQEMFLTL